jgi:hypothetical protein
MSWMSSTLKRFTRTNRPSSRRTSRWSALTVNKSRPTSCRAIFKLTAHDLLKAFENVPPFTREEIDDYAADLRETNAISDIERAYGELMTLLRREIRPAADTTKPLA